ncbi:MAG: glycosyltransferase family 2 protein [Candidatus Methylacidiphilales bacterium]
MKSLKISILLPCYNAEKYLHEALMSIVNQTYHNIEIIAIDDGSEDETLNILKSFSLLDNRIKIVINKTNLGLIKSLNKGIEICSGDYIARIDADDFLDIKRIERQVNLINNNFDLQVLSTFLFEVNNKGNVIGKISYFNCSNFYALKFKCLFETPMPHPGILIKSTILKEILYEDKLNNKHIEDYVLFSKIIYNNYKVFVDERDESRYFYRINNTSVSYKNKFEQSENALMQAQNNLKLFLNYNISLDSLRVLSLNFQVNWFAPLLLNAIIEFKKIKKIFFEINMVNMTNEDMEAVNFWYKMRIIKIVRTAIFRGNIACKFIAFFIMLKNLPIFFNAKFYLNLVDEFIYFKNKKLALPWLKLELFK